MIAELYVNMCGTELWNRARLAAYMGNGVGPPGVALRCDPCEGLVDLIPCIEDEPPAESGMFAGYNLPELDPAPWYDAAAAESKDFAGLLVLETALSPAVDRRMVQNIGHGGTLTRVRFEGRTLEVRALLVGRTCCAADYGLKWLTQALLGDFCDACDGCMLSFLTCAPSTVEGAECLTVFQEDGTRVPYFRSEESGEETEWTHGFDFVRQMHGAGLLQGPEVLARRGGSGGGCARHCGCSPLMEVEFTIGIGNPWMYRLEELVVEDQLLGGCGADECQVVFDGSAECDPFSLCEPDTACDDDPDCLPSPARPPDGSLPLIQCGCVPLVVGHNSVQVPADREWFDQVLIVEVYAGDGPVRNLSIQAWQNPMGLDCSLPENQEYFSDCNACATLLIGYIPATGVLRFDSVTREVVVTCGGVTRPAAKNIGTLEGLPFDWLAVGCQPLCLGIEVDCVNIDAAATVTVWRAGREL